MSRSNPIAMLFGILVTGCFTLVWIWVKISSPAVHLYASWALLVYGCGMGFYVWQHGLRCARLIEDVPSSNIATAAQGYTELFGEACRHEDQHAGSFGGMPVLWYRRTYSKRSDSAARDMFPFNLVYAPSHSEESETPLAIRDATGNACVLPYGAEIICARKRTEYQDDYRVVEEQIFEGDPLYVLGNFSSENSQFDFERVYREIVDNWTRDSAHRARFDTNRDGRLSARELVDLHEAAAKEARAREADAHAGSQMHVVHDPGDGRTFLISTVPPAELTGHYYWCLAGGLVLFLGCGAGAAWMIVRHLVFS